MKKSQQGRRSGVWMGSHPPGTVQGGVSQEMRFEET